jgi:hypothetical protein
MPWACPPVRSRRISQSAGAGRTPSCSTYTRAPGASQAPPRKCSSTGAIRPLPNGGSTNTMSKAVRPTACGRRASRRRASPLRTVTAVRIERTKVGLELVRGHWTLLHQQHRTGATRGRLEPERAGAGEQVQHHRPGQQGLQPVEQGLALGIGAGPQAGHRRHRQPTPAPGPADDPHPRRTAHRVSPPRRPPPSPAPRDRCAAG